VHAADLRQPKEITMRALADKLIDFDAPMAIPLTAEATQSSYESPLTAGRLSSAQPDSSASLTLGVAIVRIARLTRKPSWTDRMNMFKENCGDACNIPIRQRRNSIPQQCHGMDWGDYCEFYISDRGARNGEFR
jgi:hypothetical protein